MYAHTLYMNEVVGRHYSYNIVCKFPVRQSKVYQRVSRSIYWQSEKYLAFRQ